MDVPTSADDATLQDTPTVAVTPATQDPPVQSPKDTQPQRKRVKLESDDATATSITHPEPAEGTEPQDPSGVDPPTDEAENPSRLLRIPVELLSEILIWTGSPKFVLAVSRTCRSLRSTIMSPNSAFIWKEARKLATIIPRPKEIWDFEEPPKTFFPMPDPPPGVFGSTDTEAEARYASFVFDDGICEGCKKRTNAMYFCFDIRLRLCQSKECRSFNWVLMELRDQAAKTFVLTQETLPDGTIVHCWIPILKNALHGLSLVRAKDLAIMHDKITDSLVIEKAAEVAAFKEKLEKWGTFCKELRAWKVALGKAKTAMRNVNDRRTRQFASTYGWDEADLRSATIYGHYFNHKTLLIEEVSEDDLEVLIPKIEEELLLLQEKRGRRIQEVSKEANKGQVVAFYNKLRSSKDRPVLPSLIAFRQLDAVRVLEAGGGESGVSRNVAATLTKSGKRKKNTPPTKSKIVDTFAQGSLVQMLVNNALDAWSMRSHDTMGQLLNPPVRPGWVSVRKNVAHPVERATAWFRCVNLRPTVPKGDGEGNGNGNGNGNKTGNSKRKEKRKEKGKEKGKEKEKEKGNVKGEGNVKGKVEVKVSLCEDRVESTWREAESWDFVGACRHECIGPQGNGTRGKGLDKDQKKALVDMSCWVRDDEAINAMKAYITLLGLDEANVDTKAAVMQPRLIMCLSCDPPVLLDGRGVVGHSHRHPGEQMKIGLDFTAAQAQEYLATYPITHKRAISLCFQPTDKEKKLVEETIWACRRCYNEERGYKWDESSGPGSTAVAPARKALQIDLSKLFVSPTVWDERGQAPPKPCKLVSFHGLRSHMKAKHGYERLRDEDFVQVPSLDPLFADGADANQATQAFLDALDLAL